MYTFDSQIQEQEVCTHFSNCDNEIKNEPMLFSCNVRSAYDLGGILTRHFLNRLPIDWLLAPDLIIDSRVHMLMKGWYPCIPGFHHDDVPRTTPTGQPDYITPAYKAEHVMMIIGDCCPTEFALGKSNFPSVALMAGEKYYKVWHPIVVGQIKTGVLKSYLAVPDTLIYFNWQTWHQGTPATKDGWRWFIRATRNTYRKPTNELRKQVQVYLENPMEGW